MSVAMAPTVAGTPCEICGKPITKGTLKHYPFATECGARCFMEAVRRNFPLEGCICAVCGAEGCLMYPDVDLDDKSAPAVHHPTTICPNCSCIEAEAYLRWRATKAGYPLKPVTIFGQAVA